VVDGFLGGGQRLLTTIRIGQAGGEAAQRPGKVGQVAVRVGLGQPPEDR